MISAPTETLLEELDLELTPQEAAVLEAKLAALIERRALRELITALPKSEQDQLVAGLESDSHAVPDSVISQLLQRIDGEVARQVAIVNRQVVQVALREELA